MTLNLIEDPWIAVRLRDGSRHTIAPWQMAEPEVVAPDWSRPDFDIACLELLIGLVYLADPPADVSDWKRRKAPDPARLRERLAAFAPAFNLLGDGPRFLQDFEPVYAALKGADDIPVETILPTDRVFTRGSQAYAARGGRFAA